MADDSIGPFTAGLRLVWRRWGLLCWVFAANFVLGVLGTLPAARELHLLRHSLAGEQLLKGFDLGMFHEALRIGDINLIHFPNSPHEFTALSGLTIASYILAGLFALFMLFVSGGIVDVYLQDRRLNTGEFFAASGAFFWRFVRLALMSAVVFAVLYNAYLDGDKLADRIGDKFAAGQVAFVIWLVGIIVLILIALFVRLWFDLAKVRAVAQNEHWMLTNALRSLDIARRHVRSLLWLYLRISLAAWITALIAFLIWLKVPPTAVWATFFLLELVVLVQLGARLWQMASLTVWYKRFAPASAGEFTAPKPDEVIEPAPQLSLYPETELPPADA
jgi:hypothetical protein